MAGQRTPISWPSTCLPTLPGHVGSLGTEASGQGLAPGTLPAGEPGMTPGGLDTSSGQGMKGGPLTLTPTSSQWSGPRALCLQPDSLPSAPGWPTCSPVLLAPISHRQGSQGCTGLAKGSGASCHGDTESEVGTHSTESLEGVCVGCGAEHRVWARAGPEDRPQPAGLTAWGAPGCTSLSLRELGAQPRLLQCSRATGPMTRELGVVGSRKMGRRGGPALDQ